MKKVYHAPVVETEKLFDVAAGEKNLIHKQSIIL